MRAAEEEKKIRKRQSTPKNRIIDKLMNLAMSNQNVYKSRVALHT